MREGKEETQGQFGIPNAKILKMGGVVLEELEGSGNFIHKNI